MNNNIDLFPSLPVSYREYCDKFGSGQIKNCSPCNLEQLGNSDVSFPDECAELPCPWRCPEEISDPSSPAPPDSCDLTTAALTTQGMHLDSSYFHFTTEFNIRMNYIFSKSLDTCTCWSAMISWFY